MMFATPPGRNRWKEKEREQAFQETSQAKAVKAPEKVNHESYLREIRWPQDKSRERAIHSDRPW
ncbi:MAG: hypothetical protein DRN08_07245 [Thermoplasmata archaeon]|nr:MAG: hypothetical protein DRN08_07245 [Thermoplasmata archaeon]